MSTPDLVCTPTRFVVKRKSETYELILWLTNKLTKYPVFSCVRRLVRLLLGWLVVDATFRQTLTLLWWIHSPSDVNYLDGTSLARFVTSFYVFVPLLVVRSSFRFLSLPFTSFCYAYVCYDYILTALTVTMLVLRLLFWKSSCLCTITGSLFLLLRSDSSQISIGDAEDRSRVVGEYASFGGRHLA